MNNFTDENYISLICNGEFNAIPDFPIGELFESFFDNINYNVVREDDTCFVDFTGDATCDGEPCTILMRFRVNDKVTEFEIVEVKVDDDILDEEETLDLLEDIAYIGGAILEDCCDCGEEHSCHHCDHEDCESKKTCSNPNCHCEDCNCEDCDCQDGECHCEDCNCKDDE